MNEPKKKEQATPPEQTTQEPKTISPVIRTNWGLATHRFQHYDCTLPAGIEKDDLTKTGLWNHVAHQLSMWDEIRAIADDGTFVAELIVVYKFGNQVKCQLMHYTELQKIELATQSDIGRYHIKQRGQDKWCIVDRKTGEVIRKGIGTETLALKELSTFLATLAG
jgi:hypothetical protein